MHNTTTHAVQVMEILWNLLELASDTADRVGAAACSSSRSIEGAPDTPSPETDRCDNGAEDETLMQDKQHGAMEQSDGAGQWQQQQQQPEALGNSAGPVAQQLIEVLAKALQQQTAACNSVQVSRRCLGSTSRAQLLPPASARVGGVVCY